MSVRLLSRAPGFLVVVLSACGNAAAGDEGAAPPAAVPVQIESIETTVAARPVVGTGVVAAKEEIRLGFTIGGVVGRVMVNEGDAVRRGQTLAVLDQREIDAQVAKARSAATKAERDLNRVRSLYADSVATLEQLEDATTAYEVASSDLEAAEFNREYATVVAPADGRILRRLTEPGEMISPGAPALVLGSEQSGTVLRVGLADRDAVRLAEGDPAVLYFDAFPGARFTGHVSQLAAAAAPGTGTYDVEISLEMEGRPLSSGLVGRVEIEPSSGQSVQLVPVEALVKADGERAVVYALTAEGGRVRRLPVRVAFLRGEKVAVSDGLRGDEQLVTRGAAYLHDGATVKVVR